MLQALEEKKNSRERFFTIEPTPRVERLRQRYLNTKDKAVIDIARITTRVMKETEAEPIVTRRAKVFAAIVREVPVNIYPDELFVSWPFSEPHGSEVPLQGFGRGSRFGKHQDELDILSTRKHVPFLISEEDKRELREEIFPYWEAQRYRPSVPKALQEAGIKAIAGSRTMVHYQANFEKVLKKGLLGIKKDAEDRLARIDLSDPEEIRKIPFLEGVIMALEAASEIGGRFASKAREMAETEEDSQRREELLRIAENCDRVPAHPARTFYEGLQSVWITHMMLGWEHVFHGGIGPGKVDQYLYPYYEADIEAGRLTKEEAQELLDCWCMRYSQQFPIMTSDGARWSGPHSPGHDVTIGGLKADGTDATNELTYMFIEAMMHTPGMVEPTLVLLVHSRTPEDLLIKACQCNSLGGGYPMFVNQDLMVETLLARNEIIGGPPLTIETVRRYSVTNGCHHPTLAGMESGNMAGFGLGVSQPTVTAALELVLNNGVIKSDNEKIGLETGDPRRFKTFDEFKDAYHKQLARLVWAQRTAATIGEAASLQPTLFTSALIEDCIERGTAREEGGARYNTGQVGIVGTVDIGDSLAAIKRLVYDDRKISMDELCKALDANFGGHEDIRKMCLEAPKFGNDDDYADEQAAWVTHVVAEEITKYKTAYGGRHLPGLTPMYNYVPAGLPVGALPSGRLAGEPMSDALSPTVGSDTRGPTAVLKSVGKVNNAEVSQGQTLNMKIDPSVFEQEDGFKKLADLIRVFVDQKVDHVQINVVSAEALKAAQREPAKHKDLVVKVAGYNARFIDLYKELQDSIIARTEHSL